MKKYLLGIIAVVAAIGFSSFSPEAYKAKHGLTTYFAIKQSTGHWNWETSVPGTLECLPESGGPTCSVDAGSQPSADSFPGGVGNELYR